MVTPEEWPLDELGAWCDQEHPQDISFHHLDLSLCLTTLPSLFLVNHLFAMQGTSCEGHTWGWSGSRQGLGGQCPLPALHQCAQHSQLADVAFYWQSAQIPLPLSSFLHLLTHSERHLRLHFPKGIVI